MVSRHFEWMAQMITEVQMQKLNRGGIKYFVQELMYEIDDSDYWTILRALWLEDGKCNLIWRCLLFFSNRKREHKIMKSSDRQALRKLPKKITVYRGCKDITDEKKWNWSTDKSFVEKYISTMGEGWYIAEKVIDKTDVFAYFNSRKESEIILKLEATIDAYFQPKKRMV